MFVEYYVIYSELLVTNRKCVQTENVYKQKICTIPDLNLVMCHDV